MSVADNLLRIKSQLPPQVRLVAVSKTKPVALIEEAYTAGQRVFGERLLGCVQNRQRIVLPIREFRANF